MARWKLEALKMGICLAFPVGAFYYFNQPQYFESYVIKMKRSMYPPENEYGREIVKKVQQRLNKASDEEFRLALLEYERREQERISK